MKQISLDDYNWFLKTWDEDGVGMVKLRHEECSKDFGSCVWDYNTSTSTNFFSDFKKSHINSTQHVKCCCQKREESFKNHPQSIAPKKKTKMTPLCYKKAVEESAETIERVNEGAGS
jgi:hypothetical protein